jgi:drug/metabolite transporter (DMT)-like permease
MQKSGSMAFCAVSPLSRHYSTSLRLSCHPRTARHSSQSPQNTPRRYAARAAATTPGGYLAEAAAAKAEAAAEAEAAAQSRRYFHVRVLGKSYAFPRRTLLMLVPMICSTFVICAKMLFVLPRAVSPATFSAARLVASAVLFLPGMIKLMEKTDDRSFIASGAELGLLGFLANLLQVLGLTWTLASRAAFLNQTQIVFVPLIAALAGLESFSKRTMLAAAVALAGVAMLTLSGGLAALTASLAGDACEVLSSIFYSAYIIRVGIHVRRRPALISGFMAIKACVQAACSCLWVGAAPAARWWQARAAAAPDAAVTAAVALAPWTPTLIATSAALIAWCGLVVGGLAMFLHLEGQTGVSASEATIIFATQPLWASGLAAVFLGETFGNWSMAGASLIVGSSIISASGNSDNVVCPKSTSSVPSSSS